MGANISGGGSIDGDETGPPLRPRLDDIPESCAALILARLNPPEICNLARLNRSFRSASLADFIWESKLPSNYKLIVEKVFVEEDRDLMNLKKKDVYARLTKPIPFDGGTKEIWLDKNTGGVCLSMSSKALTITGIDDRRYWNHISTEESRYRTVAYLQQTWWFEVDGELEFQFPAGTYSLFFRLHLGKSSKRLGRRVCNTEHVHGWDIKPVQFQLTTSDGQHVISRCYLDSPGSWVLYHVGDFIVENSNALTNIKFSSTQIDCTHTKGGLCVDAAFIYPSSVRKEVKLCS
ncbi:F-box protein PP2-A13-like [Gossypium australe]|uniref:F-box protein PP2-A13-like n=1 Tax=Gossypium australe TaxID=47621 RepID=A0A5B6UVT6_9ROSI|nr:F-box protein PP2-A13-like [Gossypium australe]